MKQNKCDISSVSDMTTFQFEQLFIVHSPLAADSCKYIWKQYFEVDMQKYFQMCLSH